MEDQDQKTWKQLGVLICEICQFKTSDQGTLQVHSCRRKNNDGSFSVNYNSLTKTFLCSLCSFKDEENPFLEHLQQHLVKNPYKCDICKKGFRDRHLIKQHSRERHPSSEGNFTLRVSDISKGILNSAKEKGLAYFTPTVVGQSKPSKEVENPQNAPKKTKTVTSAECKLPPSTTDVSPVSTAVPSIFTLVTSSPSNGSELPVTRSTAESSICSDQTKSCTVLSTLLPTKVSSSSSTAPVRIPTASEVTVVDNRESRGVVAANSVSAGMVKSPSSFRRKNEKVKESKKSSTPVTDSTSLISSVSSFTPAPFQSTMSLNCSMPSVNKTSPAAPVSNSENYNAWGNKASSVCIPPFMSPHVHNNLSKQQLQNNINITPYPAFNNIRPPLMVHHPHMRAEQANAYQYQTQNFQYGISNNRPLPLMAIPLYPSCPPIPVSYNYHSAYSPLYVSPPVGSAAFFSPPVCSAAYISPPSFVKRYNLSSAHTKCKVPPDQIYPVSAVSASNVRPECQTASPDGKSDCAGVTHFKTENVVVDGGEPFQVPMQEKICDFSYNFSVVNNVCLCLKCKEKFKDVDLFCHHIHKHIHMQDQKCCPSGFSAKCPLLKIILSNLNERSMGLLEQIPSSETQPPHQKHNTNTNRFPSLSAALKLEPGSFLGEPSIADDCHNVSSIMNDISFRGTDQLRSNSYDIDLKSVSMNDKGGDICERSLEDFEAINRDNSSPVLSSQNHTPEIYVCEADLEKYQQILHTNMTKDFYKCCFPNCRYSSHQSIDLLTHTESNHGKETEFCCFYCGYVGEKVTDLVHHIAVHNFKQSEHYSCSVMDDNTVVQTMSNQKLCVLISSLERGSKGHENIKFQCNICENKFSSLPKLTRHLQISELKTFGCKCCNSTFLDSRSFEYHLLKEHPGYPKYRRVNLNFLCQFRKVYCHSFKKILQQYIETPAAPPDQHNNLQMSAPVKVLSIPLANVPLNLASSNISLSPTSMTASPTSTASPTCSSSNLLPSASGNSDLSSSCSNFVTKLSTPSTAGDGECHMPPSIRIRNRTSTSPHEEPISPCSNAAMIQPTLVASTINQPPMPPQPTKISMSSAKKPHISTSISAQLSSGGASVLLTHSVPVTEDRKLGPVVSGNGGSVTEVSSGSMCAKTLSTRGTTEAISSDISLKSKSSGHELTAFYTDTDNNCRSLASSNELISSSGTEVSSCVQTLTTTTSTKTYFDSNSSMSGSSYKTYSCIVPAKVSSSTDSLKVPPIRITSVVSLANIPLTLFNPDKCINASSPACKMVSGPTITNEASTCPSSLSRSGSNKRHFPSKDHDCEVEEKKKKFECNNHSGANCTPFNFTEPFEGEDKENKKETILYGCKLCSYACEWNEEEMTKHIGKKHKDMRQYVCCYYCGNPYFERKQLENHIKFHHDNASFKFKDLPVEHIFSKKSVQIFVVNSQTNSKSLKEKETEILKDGICCEEKTIQDIVEQEDLVSSKPSSGDSNFNQCLNGLSSTTEMPKPIKKKKKIKSFNFECKRCHLHLPSISSIESHYKENHENATVKWIDKLSGYIYSLTGTLLKGQMDAQSPKRRYLCNLCSYRGLDRARVHKHQNVLHPDDRVSVVKLSGYCCSSKNRPSVPEPIPSTDVLKKVITSRKEPLRYNCHICFAKLSTEFFLRYHLAKHRGFPHMSTLSTSDGVLICAHCGYIAKSNTDLANHVATHVTDRRYKCSQCDWEDHHKKSIQSHIKKRHGQDSDARVFDREKKRGKMKLKVVNLNPSVLIRRLSEW